MNYLQRFGRNREKFIVLAAAVCFSSCGGIFLVEGGGAGTKIRALPARLEYNINDTFSKTDDLTVCAYFENGAVSLIPPDKFEVKVNGKTVGIEFFVFESSGRPEITVVYNTISSRYFVQVNDPLGIGGGDSGGGSGSGGGGGIVIDW
jgi:hypothetical protein